MTYSLENIHYKIDLPVNIFVHNLNYTQNHWHDALEILFVLDGNIRINLGNSSYELAKEDLIVINPNEVHSTNASKANLVLALQISNEWIKKNTSLKNMSLSCNSRTSTNTSLMDDLRGLLAQMIWVYNKQSMGFELQLQSYLFDLLYKLFVYFPVVHSPQAEYESTRHIERISKIIQYIQDNYADDLMLQDLAGKEHLSVSYISRFFKKYTGTSFKEYLVKIRLEHAVKDLLYSDKSILNLSLDNGFPNTKSFIDVFKKFYEETPSLYRKKAKSDFQYLYGPIIQSKNYSDMVYFDMFSSLYKYLNDSSSQYLNESNAGSLTMNLVEVDLTQPSHHLCHAWKTLITIGRASDVLKPEIQRQLKEARNELGFNYLRFHGIFDDDMRVYQEDESGNPMLDFSAVDRILDAMIEIGLKPFIELSFMPESLAKEQNSIFFKPSIISLPKDMHKWCTLVESFFLHCMDRYSNEEVLSWFFEFWNEPEMTGVFWNDSMEEYLEFYQTTYQTIKNVSNKLMVGGPAVCIVQNLNLWLEKYFTFCDQAYCLPDFFSFHFYLHAGSLQEVQDAVLSEFHRVTLTQDPEALSNSINSMATVLAKYGYNAENIYLTEWNASPSHRDLSHDTLFMASFLVKNILENAEKLKCFGYWVLSDLIEEYEVPNTTFHGGMGLITGNGIKKAGYYAFKLLNLLGDEVITSGPGYFLTKDFSGYQLLLYNYCHFDPLYCSMDHSAISPTDRYPIFKDSFSKNFHFVLNGLSRAETKIREYLLSRSQGSAFDAWVEIGAPEILDNEDMQYLSQRAVPLMQKSTCNIQSGYSIQRLLKPHEVRLIKFFLNKNDYLAVK